MSSTRRSPRRPWLDLALGLSLHGAALSAWSALVPGSSAPPAEPAPFRVAGAAFQSAALGQREPRVESASPGPLRDGGVGSEPQADAGLEQAQEPGAAPTQALLAEDELAPAPAPVASYTLEARLEPATHTIGGSGTIVFRNTARVATEELFFHFYLEAFAGSETLFHRSPFARARGGLGPRRVGGLRLERLVARELGDWDLLPTLEPHSPGDPADRTDRRVALPRALEPGETLTLDIAWTSTLPELTARTGVSRDFYFAGQWFPKLARLEPDGGWAHFPFHPHAEFYADFGDYDVTLDVPQEMIVGATGERVDERSEGGRRIVRHRARAVHDFAWTAWRSFRERRQTIDGVEVTLLYPPGHDRNAERTLATLRLALPHFSERYGDYPYPVLTVVHPPSHASQAGGMEYPTLITTGGPWHQTLWSRLLETVTVHELAHQWFYGLLASNERRWPVLDEGLTSYVEAEAMDSLFGATSAAALPGLSLSADAVRRVLAAGYEGTPLALDAAEFVDFEHLGSVVYNRAALFFSTLERIYGRDALGAALGRYTRRHRFRHPEPNDLLRALGEVLGADAAEATRRALFEGAGVSHRVRDLEVSARAAAASPALDPAAGGAPSRAPTVVSRFSVWRRGELSLPVAIRFVTDDGQAHETRWDGGERWTVIEHEGPSAVVRAEVDPERAVLLDPSFLDNGLSRSDGGHPHTTERLVFALQLLLGAVAP